MMITKKFIKPFVHTKYNIIIYCRLTNKHQTEETNLEKILIDQKTLYPDRRNNMFIYKLLIDQMYLNKKE